MKITREMVAEASALEEDAARRVALIMGPSSASAKAIATLERRRAAGEDVFIINDGRTWCVGVFRDELTARKPKP